MGSILHRELTRPYISIYMYIYTLVHAHTHMYTYIYINTFIFIHIHIHTYTHIHTHIYTHIHAYLYILRRNKQMNRIKKRVQLINTYTMTFIGNNRQLYLIILAINNAENQFTAIVNSLEDPLCI